MKYEDILLMGLTGLMHTPASAKIVHDSRPIAAFVFLRYSQST